MLRHIDAAFDRVAYRIGWSRDDLDMMLGLFLIVDVPVLVGIALCL